MPRYFFDLLNADGLAADEEGTELTSLDDVQNEAAYALADLLREEVRVTMGSPLARDLTVVVRNENGLVFEAKYSFDLPVVQ